MDLDFNPALTKRLKILAKYPDEWQHMLFYGPSGSGKMTRIRALLKMTYGDQCDSDITKTRVATQRITEKKKSFSFHYSPIHWCIDFQRYSSMDRYIIRDCVMSWCQYPNTEYNTRKIIVLYHWDHASKLCQNMLRKLMDRASRNVVFILVASSFNKVAEPLRSRCLVLRNPAPRPADVATVLRAVAKANGQRLTKGRLAAVLEQCTGPTTNLKEAIALFQLICEKKGYVVPHITYYRELYDIVRNPVPLSLKVIADIRKRIYALHMADLDLLDLLRYVVGRVMKDEELSGEQKAAIVEHSVRYSVRLSNGNKPPLHAEAFILTAMSVVRDPTPRLSRA